MRNANPLLCEIKTKVYNFGRYIVCIPKNNISVIIKTLEKDDYGVKFVYRDEKGDELWLITGEPD